MRKVFKTGLMALVMTFVMALSIVVINAQDAQAGWFSDVSIKKCDVKLDRYEFDWTGREVRPKVFVSYEGRNLRENVDYTLKYSNNIDAGKGEVKVKGIGDFKSSITLEFTIWGIDISRECTFNVHDGELEVYYQGRIVSTNNYRVSSTLVSEKLIGTKPSNDSRKEYRTYEIKEKYTIKGKGQYYWTYEHVFRYNETRLERIDDVKPDHPGYQPEPHPGYQPAPHPGYGPQPRPEEPKPQPVEPGKPDGPGNGGHPDGPGHGNGGGHTPNPGPGHGGNNPGGPGHGGHPGRP